MRPLSSLALEMTYPTPFSGNVITSRRSLALASSTIVRRICISPVGVLPRRCAGMCRRLPPIGVTLVTKLDRPVTPAGRVHVVDLELKGGAGAGLAHQDGVDEVGVGETCGEGLHDGELVIVGDSCPADA